MDLIFSLSSLQVIIVTFWIEFDLIFAFFYIQVITMVFWIELDIISAFFCVQVGDACVHKFIHMLFWGGVPPCK